MEKFEQEEKRIEKKRKTAYAPMRFYTKKGEGEEIVILDESLEHGIAIREHNIQGSDGKWGNFEPCLDGEGVECPVCKSHGANSALILFLTVNVRKEWTSKKTGETHAYSKMLLPVKRGLIPKFRKLEAIALKNNGTLRGTMLLMERGTEDTSFSTGEPVPLEDGSAMDFYTEEDLLDEFGHDEVKSREGKVIKPANEDTKPYDYRKLFPKPDAAELRERHGVDPEPGSVEDNGEEFNESEEEDDIPMDHPSDENPFMSLAERADDEAQEENKILQAAAKEAGVDYLDYATWCELADAVIEAGVEFPKPARKTAKKAAKKAAKKTAAKKSARRRRRAPATDNDSDAEEGGGDVDGW